MNIMQKNDKVNNLNNVNYRPVSGVNDNRYRAVTPDRLNVYNRPITPDKNKQVVKGIGGGGIDAYKNKPNPSHNMVNVMRPDRPKTPDYDKNKIIIKKK